MVQREFSHFLNLSVHSFERLLTLLSTASLGMIGFPSLSVRTVSFRSPLDS